MEGVLSAWAESGITKEELKRMKSTIVGSMQVGYDTTGGLARGILSAAVNREGLSILMIMQAWSIK